MQSTARVELRLNHTLCNFNVSNVYVEDTCTMNPFTRLLVSMTPQSGLPDDPYSCSGSPGKLRGGTPRTPAALSQKSSQCSVTFDNKPGLNRLTVLSSPLDITLNEKCVQKLLAFIAAPSNSRQAKAQSTSRVSSVSRFAAQSSSSSAGLSVTEISVEMYAPKFIIPENCYRDEGFMLLDADHLVLNGSVHPRNGMQLNVC